MAAAALAVAALAVMASAVLAAGQYLEWADMDCKEDSAQDLPCSEPAEATAEACKAACDGCTGCLAAVVFKGGHGPAKCHLKGCDTSCGCYKQGPGQYTCNETSPPADAVPALKHNLYARVIEPHFCRNWAYSHHGVAGHVVPDTPVPVEYLSWTGMDCKEAGAQDPQCAEPAQATEEACKAACDGCTGCLAAVVFKGGQGPAKCHFKGCDTGCGCYKQGPGQYSCNQTSPPASAVRSLEHDLYARALEPHFCRNWAYSHHGVSGQVVPDTLRLWAEGSAASGGNHPWRKPPWMATAAAGAFWGLAAIVLLALALHAKPACCRHGLRRPRPAPEYLGLLPF